MKTPTYNQGITMINRKQSLTQISAVFLLLNTIARVATTYAPTVVAPTASSPLIRKCCPPDQQLDASLRSCEIYPDSPTLGYSASSETVSALLERSPDGVPWWLDANLTLLETDGVNPATGPFLEGQSPHARVGYGAHPVCPRFDRLFVPTFSRDRLALLRDGRLRLALRTVQGGANSEAGFVVLPPEEYCVDRVAAPSTPARPNTFVVMACPCTRAMCVRKCCANSQVYEATNWRKSVELSCVTRARRDTPWAPTTFEDSEDDVGGHLVLAGTGLNCSADERPALLVPEPPASGTQPATFRLLPNGSALADGHLRAGALSRFCAERVRFEGAMIDNLHFCAPRSPPATSAVAGEPLRAQSALYGALMVLGAASLLVTLVVYALLPDLRRSAHARALVCHVAALFAGSVAQATGQLRATLPAAECYAVAFVVQFSFLAAFFWLNAMCIDIAWAFSGLRAMQGSITERDRRKFRYYSAYAWGCPALISGVTALLEFADGLPAHLLRPNFGKRTCWFYSKLATLAYFYGPMAALLLANVALFAYTTWRIVRVQRETAVLSAGDSGRHDGGGAGTGGGSLRGERKRLMLYLKLFCLMGVTWVTEIISWAEGSDGVYWYVTDAINLLRGLFIFVLFCCKPKVLKLLRRRIQELSSCPSGACLSSSVVGGASSTSSGGRGRGARSSALWSLVRRSQKGGVAPATSTTSATTLHAALVLGPLEDPAGRTANGSASAGGAENNNV